MQGMGVAEAGLTQRMETDPALHWPHWGTELTVLKVPLINPPSRPAPRRKCWLCIRQSELL